MQVFGVTVEEGGLDVANRERCTHSPRPLPPHMVSHETIFPEAAGGF